MTTPIPDTSGNPLFRFFRKLQSVRLFALLFGAPAPAPLATFGGTPDGLRLLHCANSTPEAELLTQVLTESGIHVEFVPTWTSGAFGVAGSSDEIYVQAADFDRATQLLKEYFSENELEVEPLEK